MRRKVYGHGQSRLINLSDFFDFSETLSVALASSSVKVFHLPFAFILGAFSKSPEQLQNRSFKYFCHL
jgi:hypothetical protein